MVPNTVERVPLNTSDEINQRIARETNRRVHFYAANPVGIDRRLRELDEEWDIERVLEANAASAALAGTMLAVTVHKRWLMLPALVAGFLGRPHLPGHEIGQDGPRQGPVARVVPIANPAHAGGGGVGSH